MRSDGVYFCSKESDKVVAVFLCVFCMNFNLRFKKMVYCREELLGVSRIVVDDVRKEL
jgi:hypothetical protein